MNDEYKARCLSELIRRTKAGVQHCREVLERCSWDVDKATTIVLQEVLDHAQRGQ